MVEYMSYISKYSLLADIACLICPWQGQVQEQEQGQE